MLPRPAELNRSSTTLLVRLLITYQRAALSHSHYFSSLKNLMPNDQFSGDGGIAKYAITSGIIACRICSANSGGI
jgi:hypothetical protein